MADEKKKPVHKITQGWVTIPIWENTGEADNSFLSAGVAERRKQVSEKDWKSYPPSTATDCACASIAYARAAAFIEERNAERRTEKNSG